MIALGLNFILGVMLFCGLILGLRLEGRLRALRNSQADFAKAVSELDQAAVRTEDSLVKLRAGTEAARTELAARIDQARLLAQRLEKLTKDADRALSQPLVLNQPAPAPIAAAPVATAPVTPRRPEVRPAPEPRTPAEARYAAIRQTLSEPRVDAAKPEPAPSPRSRAQVDDDLFETPTRRADEFRSAERRYDERRAPLSAMAGGRR